jgi:hypothetical protein
MLINLAYAPEGERIDTLLMADARQRLLPQAA